MPRRTATMLASLLTLIALLCAGALIPVPYSEMSPGPTVNTLGSSDGEPVLQISGHPTYPTSGHLNMTTVRLTGSGYKMNLVEAVYGWLTHDNAVVPRSTLYPDDKSPQEVNQDNAEEFSQSEQSAKVAALRKLGISVPSHVVVASVAKGGPALGRLHAGDVIKEVDGEGVGKPADVVKLVTQHRPRQKVRFTVVPAEKSGGETKADERTSGERTVTVPTRNDDGRAAVGITAGLDYSFPFDIDIKLPDVGGPSAGLMFALGIIDKLSRTDLTGGKFIAGTGTIEADGKVGPIGGISMKTVGARSEGAEYFLTPEANCSDAAKDVPDGLTLVKVRTLDDAMKALAGIRKKDTASLPRCTAD